jgi:hypothetical protein
MIGTIRGWLPETVCWRWETAEELVVCLVID